MNENNNQDNWVGDSGQSPAPEQGQSQVQQKISSQAQVYNPTQPQNQAVPTQSQDDAKKATTLCVISLVCHYAPALGIGSIASALQSSSNEAISATGDMLSGLLSLVMFGAWVASWVLMIVVRVKYKTSTFGKVLMWIYIIGAILSVLAIIAIIFLFAAALSACAGGSGDVIEGMRSLT